MKEKLKNCPKCGGEAELGCIHIKGVNVYYGLCEQYYKCGCECAYGSVSKTKAIRMWNEMDVPEDDD